MSMGKQDFAIFDFDGTLAMIARHPGNARIGKREKSSLAALARKCNVFILTGRPAPFVQRQVRGTGAKVLGLCGNPAGRKSAPMKKLESLARLLVRREKGVRIESKPSGFTLHYRNSRLSRAGVLAKIRGARALAKKCARIIEGRKAFEFLPKGARTKAETLEILVRRAAPSRVVFIGDDQSDCEAIRKCAVHKNFAGALVSSREVECARIKKIRRNGIFRFAAKAIGC